MKRKLLDIYQCLFVSILDIFRVQIRLYPKY